MGDMPLGEIEGLDALPGWPDCLLNLYRPHSREHS